MAPTGKSAPELMGFLLVPAVAAAATAATIISAASAATAAATELPLDHRTSFVHRQRPATEFGAVQLLDCGIGIVVAHFDKTEALRSASGPIGNDAHRLHSSALCEQSIEITFRRIERQITNKNFFRH